MNMLDAARLRLARWIAPGRAPLNRQVVGTRMYHNAQASRLTGGWNTPNNSSDAELISSLVALRGRSRALIRDAPYAKRAKVAVVNNIIGTGIGMQAQARSPRGKLLDDVNDAIEAAWMEWCVGENCHTGGRLHFSDLERQLMGQVFEGGEIFVRKHRRRFGRSKVPLALEIVEPERLAEDYTQAVVRGDTMLKMGIEQDEFGRPLAFWIRRLHPNDVRYSIAQRTDQLYKVSARDMYHLAVIDRWPQSRGEPWLHCGARRLNDMDGLSEAEIVAARGAASYMGIITNEDGEADLPPIDPDNPSEAYTFDLEPGAVEELPAGKKFDLVAPNRPNVNLDPFLRMMLREVAMGSHVSYEAISGDYSQSNLSSSRMGQQEIRDDYRALQQWFIRSFRQSLHQEWLETAVMAGAIPAIDINAYMTTPERFEAVAFKPRGWAYINPKEDVEAAGLAIRYGLSTRTHEIARYGNGLDREDIDALREQELAAEKAKGLVYATDAEVFDNAGKKHPAPAEEAPAPAANSAPVSREGTILPMRSNHA